MEKKNFPDQAEPPYPVLPGSQPHGSQFSQPLNPQNLQGGFVPPPPVPPSYDSHYPQQASVTTTSVLVSSQPVAHFGPDAQALTCPHCHAQIITRVESKASTKTHLFALLLCCCVCWPCAWIPYCMDSCQNRNHHCPHCGAYLGTYEN